MPQNQAHITKDSGIVILLLGLTGSGKSTFINAAAGRTVADVNHNLTSSSDLIVRDFIVKHPQTTRSLVFVDTPGFDHFEASDKEVLNKIVEWLKKSCNSDVQFGGIVYLHDITASRVQKEFDAAALALRTLSRPEPASHLLMTTVKWGRVQQDPRAQKRELELQANSWKKILDGGAHLCRFADTKDSAWEIVDKLLQKEPLELLVLQQELDRIHRFIPSRPPRLHKEKKGFFAQLFSRLFK
ncbi:hypothetical protein GALMADRAFT_264377 [Galerina marginata CBS 339.88]|uniref:G domain-containing protein n=1 Tax=Galerina marginata (strain CBS 339.88) TaxID=685588 RepID=A0A067TFX0_GALM3|nr:hypothetical protein GALMADRAFT_264377 [Galerina marginata CBS 339.88]